jgi:hypothetical protein
VTKSGVFDPRRMAVALLVLLLHVAIVGVFLRVFIQRPSVVPQTHEVILQFTQPAPPAKKPKPGHPLPAIHLTAPAIPRTNEIVLPPPETEEPSLRNLYFYLYDCAPENFSHLSESERERCASASIGPRPNDTNALRNLPSHSHDAPHWSDELAREKQPFGANPMSSSTEKSVQKMLKCPPKGSPIEGPIDECGDIGDRPGRRDADPGQDQ